MVDWDSVFSYQTVKVVNIRDKRLGILYYLFLLGIILYVIGWTLVYEKRYLLLESPTGSVRMSLLRPSTYTAIEDLKYCNPPHPDFNGFDNYPCEYWDQNDVVFPATEATAMLVATRTSVLNGTLNCDLGDSNCAYEDGPENHIYMADIERFTLLIDHTFYTSFMQRNAEDITGQLLGPDNGAKKPCLSCSVIDDLPSPNIFGEIGSPDILELSYVLEAANMTSIDVASDEEPSRTDRNNGIVLLIFLEYTNTGSYNLSSVTYTMKVAHIKNTKFKSVEAQYAPYFHAQGGVRTLINRHGIRIVTLQIGEIGKFDFQTLLLSFVSGLGLLAVATTVVDVLATKVLPQRKQYAKYKILETIDFSDLEAINSRRASEVIDEHTKAGMSESSNLLDDRRET